MLAHALLAVLTAGEHAAGSPPAGLIPLTCNELQRLLTQLVLEPARRHAGLVPLVATTSVPRPHQPLRRQAAGLS
jgi:hypothetical protein